MRISKNGKSYDVALVRYDDGASLAFAGPASLFPVGTVVQLGDERWTVRTVSGSAYVPGVTKLWLV